MFRLPSEVQPPAPPALTLEQAVQIAELVCKPLKTDKTAMRAHDLARRIEPTVSTELKEGAYRRVLLAGGWAIKVDKLGIIGSERYVGSVGEALVIERLKREHADMAQHFPHTHIINPFTVVQERCDINPTKTLSLRWRDTIYTLASSLEIGDTHEYNIGWRGDTPVFIDVQINNFYDAFPEVKQYGGAYKAPLTLNA